MYYKQERSYDELLLVVKAIKPYKLIKRGVRYWEPNEFEGYDVSMVQALVDEIERSQILSADQKAELEKGISDKITKTGYSNLTRGLYNVLLMVQNNATAFTRGYKLTSLEGLKKHALVHTKYIETTRTVTIPAIEGVMGTEDKSETKRITVYVLSLTEYGKKEAQRLAYYAERTAHKEKRILQKLNIV